MNDAERERRLQAKLAEEQSHELRWWWLSFVDTERPGGSQFLGVAIIEARGPILAVRQAYDLGVNPGGEVAIKPLPGPPAPGDRGRLLNREEAEALLRYWAQ